MTYEQYLQSTTWRVLRRLALEKADYRCQLCNKNESLEVHHRTYDRCWGNERLEDLTALCSACHKEFTLKFPVPLKQAMESLEEAQQRRLRSLSPEDLAIYKEELDEQNEYAKLRDSILLEMEENRRLMVKAGEEGKSLTPFLEKHTELAKRKLSLRTL